MTLLFPDGSRRQTRFNVMGVAKPVFSGSELNRTGHTVIFAPEYAKITREGRSLSLVPDNGVFYLPAKLEPSMRTRSIFAKTRAEAMEQEVESQLSSSSSSSSSSSTQPAKSAVMDNEKVAKAPALRRKRAQGGLRRCARRGHGAYLRLDAARKRLAHQDARTLARRERHG